MIVSTPLLEQFVYGPGAVNAETELIAMLRATPVLALMAQGFFLNASDEATPLPYVVVTATHAPELLLTGDIDLDVVTFTIACWGAGAAVAERVADLVMIALLDSRDEYTISARTGGFDQQTATDACVITAERWIT